MILYPKPCQYHDSLPRDPNQHWATGRPDPYCMLCSTVFDSMDTARKHVRSAHLHPMRKALALTPRPSKPTISRQVARALRAYRVRRASQSHEPPCPIERQNVFCAQPSPAASGKHDPIPDFQYAKDLQNRRLNCSKYIPYTTTPKNNPPHPQTHSLRQSLASRAAPRPSHRAHQQEKRTASTRAITKPPIPAIEIYDSDSPSSCHKQTPVLPSSQHLANIQMVPLDHLVIEDHAMPLENSSKYLIPKRDSYMTGSATNAKYKPVVRDDSTQNAPPFFVNGHSHTRHPVVQTEPSAATARGRAPQNEVRNRSITQRKDVAIIDLDSFEGALSDSGPQVAVRVGEHCRAGNDQQRLSTSGLVD